MDDIKNDIQTAEKYFKRYVVNIFVENDSELKPDFKLIDKFLNEIYPAIKDKNNVEINMSDTDWGVG